MSMDRGTGGNGFIPADATFTDLLMAVQDGLIRIRTYARATGRTLDLAQITVTTSRVQSGRISVNVEADLGDER